MIDKFFGIQNSRIHGWHGSVAEIVVNIIGLDFYEVKDNSSYYAAGDAHDKESGHSLTQVAAHSCNLSHCRRSCTWGAISGAVASFVERYEFGPIDDNVLIVVASCIVIAAGVHFGPIF